PCCPAGSPFRGHQTRRRTPSLVSDLGFDVLGGCRSVPPPTAARENRGMDRNDELFASARNVIPGGVNSPVRAYGSVGGTPRFLASAKGASVTDADGREYVDLVATWGPALLGHAHPEV